MYVSGNFVRGSCRYRSDKKYHVLDPTYISYLNKSSKSIDERTCERLRAFTVCRHFKTKFELLLCRTGGKRVQTLTSELRREKYDHIDNRKIPLASTVQCPHALILFIIIILRTDVRACTLYALAQLDGCNCTLHIYYLINTKLATNGVYQ